MWMRCLGYSAPSRQQGGIASAAKPTQQSYNKKRSLDAPDHLLQNRLGEAVGRLSGDLCQAPGNHGCIADNRADAVTIAATDGLGNQIHEAVGTLAEEAQRQPVGVIAENWQVVRYRFLFVQYLQAGRQRQQPVEPVGRCHVPIPDSNQIRNQFPKRRMADNGSTFG